MKKAITYGFSLRADGDMREHHIVSNYLTKMGLDSNNLVTAQQVHGIKVEVVNDDARGSSIPEVDGLMYKAQGSNRQIILGIRTADCIPLLFFDSVNGLIAAVHAGWRGTLGGIAEQTLSKFIEKGSLPSTIHCLIGPHIRSCCYSVSEERISLFTQVFGNISVRQENSTNYLDLTQSLLKQLHDFGIANSHITDVQKCTSCNVHEYYSFRKETKETFGEMLGFIAITG